VVAPQAKFRPLVLLAQRLPAAALCSVRPGLIPELIAALW